MTHPTPNLLPAVRAYCTERMARILARLPFDTDYKPQLDARLEELHAIVSVIDGLEKQQVFFTEAMKSDLISQPNKP